MTAPLRSLKLQVRTGGRMPQDLEKRTSAQRGLLIVTPRQAEILSLVARGFGDKEIASNLGVAPRTIRTHLERLFREYGFSNRTEAVAAWLRPRRQR